MRVLCIGLFCSLLIAASAVAQVKGTTARINDFSSYTPANPLFFNDSTRFAKPAEFDSGAVPTTYPIWGRSRIVARGSLGLYLQTHNTLRRLIDTSDVFEFDTLGFGAAQGDTTKKLYVTSAGKIGIRADLNSGTGGGGDGQDADSIQGKPVTTTNRTVVGYSFTALVYDSAAGQYVHKIILVMDTTGYAAAKGDTTKKLYIDATGRVAIRADLNSGTGGGGDGQDADSIQGKPVTTTSRTVVGWSYTVLVFDSAAGQYVHKVVLLMDTTAYSAAKGDRSKKLYIDAAGKVAIIADSLRQQPLTHITGGTKWYSGATNQSTTTTLTMTGVNNTLRAYPFYSGSTSLAIDSMMVEITTAVSGGIALGIYSDDGSGYPGALFVSSGYDTAGPAGFLCKRGEATWTPTGAKTLAANTLYWIVVTVKTGTTAFRAYPVTAIPTVLGFANSTGTNRAITAWQVALTFNGTLPSTFPGGATAVQNAACPLLLWRAK